MTDCDQGLVGEWKDDRLSLVVSILQIGGTKNSQGLTKGCGLTQPALFGKFNGGLENPTILAVAEVRLCVLVA